MATVFIPHDRHAAMVRGLWRLLAAAVLGGFVVFVVRRMDWEQYWRDQRLVGICWAFILTVAALPALGLAVSGIRWLVASLNANLGVELNDRNLVVRAGPFGNRSLDWPRVSVKLDGDLALDAWVALPEDAVGVSLFHPSASGDVFDPIRTLLGSRSPDFVRALRNRIARTPREGD